MKKLTLVLAAILMSCYSFSQGFGAGLKGGLNFPTYDAIGLSSGVTTPSNEGASGYHIGGFARIRVSKIAIQPEVIYSFQKTEFSTDILGQPVNIEQKLSYLTVPVMLKFFLLAGVNIQLGPQFGFAMSGKQVDDILGPKTTTDFKDDIKGMDLSAAFGAGIDLPFGLDLHARYVLGLSDINDQPDVESTKNSMIQVSIGYAFIDVGR